MELVSAYKNDDHKTCSKYSERGLDRDGDTYANKDRQLSYTESSARNHSLSVGNKCVVLSTVCFGLMCIFLAAAIVVLHIKLMAEREVQATDILPSSSRDQMEKDRLQNSFSSLSQKKLELETRVNDLTAEKSQLQSNFNALSQMKLELETRVRDLATEKSQLETRVNDLTAVKSQFQSNFNSLSQKKLELETRVNDLTTEKSQLQSNFNSLSQKKLELENRVRDLTAEKSQSQSNFNALSQMKLELETRVRDLATEKSQLETRVNDLTAVKSQFQSNFNSLSQKKLELETRVNDLTADKRQLQSNFNALSHMKLELETRVRDLATEKSQLETRVNLTAEKCQLQSNFSSLSQKKLELESRVRSLSEDLMKEASKRVCFFMSNEEKSWSDSRQYCRDRGADLVIINTEEKQRFISSFIKERVWIGLSDTEQEGNMKWVDNSPLNRGFWLKGEPNDQGGNEDCIELMPTNPVLNNWNDFPCSEKKKCFCEK